ncbi:MAG: large-conductance mechanosensitive channel protein MscL [Candidatus Nomurabacteria bacterium]|jgi:large conductance mechanosensitive channel|nr:large-conductance mechanosensitive channel protein MscL [Candidatus Nomurabacteria bacterium]
MKDFIKEFKKFIGRGNVVDLAVGVIIGGAFGKIVSSLVNDVLMPTIGILMGGFNFAGWKIHVPALVNGGAGIEIGIGSFIQNIIDFLIIAVCIFIFVKFINKLVKLPPTTETDKKPDSAELKVLKEIRDKLK